MRVAIRKNAVNEINILEDTPFRYLSVDCRVSFNTYVESSRKKASFLHYYLVNGEQQVLVVQEQKKAVEREQQFDDREIMNHGSQINIWGFSSHLAVDQSAEAGRQHEDGY